MNDQDSSRPTTPESPLDSSLYHATSTIDDLTAALADFSRVPSPEPVSALSCCCGREDCENFKAWLELKSRLGSRLVLSAEVGQALLQRHEAYVRQTERKLRNNMARYPNTSRSESSTDTLNRELDELMKEKQQLEKQLNQALVNNEVTEVSSKTILQELQEARETISRLTAHHARSIGWDTRLSAAMKERDDMQQERDGETHRARLAESRFAALKEKTAKLQAEVRRLQENLEQKRQHRLESSETLIQDARSRLESFRNSHLGVNAKLAEEELTSVLESLVQDNETLQHDNAELQHLLSEAREDLHALQEEVEESRANPPPPSRSGANTPHSRHFHSGSVTSISLKDYSMFSPRIRRNTSSDGTSKRRQAPAQIDVRLSPAPPELPTPNALRSPMSTVDSLAPVENKWQGQSSPRSSHISYELDDEAEKDGSPPLYERPRGHRPLLLLTRSRAVQTDSTLSGTLSPSPFPSHVSSVSPHDPRSESSSFSETPSSHVSLILERLTSLFNRFTQADALTLTNRLKRQNLKGADVGHLSRSTINNIVSEATGLRAQYRSLLEDEKVVTSCTRKDLRMLFKLVKDMFSEMANLRITLNDVILDPTSAPRISELALNPGKAEAETREKEREGATEGGVSGWMAPISKLFSPVGRTDPVGDRPGLTRSSSARAPSTRPQRFVPKLGPALAASATTVNVEFSGSGVGRAVTSSFSAQPIPVADSSMGIASTSQSVSSGLMDIFAGAPKPIENADPWVILPTAHSTAPPPTQVSTLRMSQPFVKISESTATIGRTTGRKNVNRLSRNVDAVIDLERPPDIDEEPDYLPPLLERTLRRRGLSDSSIHSTFTNQAQADEPRSPTSPERPSRQHTIMAPTPLARAPSWPERTSVFQALSRTMMGLKAGVNVMTAPSSALAREIKRVATPERSRSPASFRQARTEASTEGSGGRSTPSSLMGPPPPPLAVDNSSGSSAVVSISTEAVTSEPPSLPQTPVRKATEAPPSRVASPTRGVLPNFTSWATANVLIDPVSGSDPFIASSLRDETYMQRVARGRSGPKDETHLRDFY